MNKSRFDSATAAVQTMKTANLPPLQPLAHLPLPEEARDHFDLIIRYRTRSEWTEHDLVLAHRLACCHADIDRIEALVRTEGDLVDGAPHVGHKLLAELHRRQLMLTRTLQLQAATTNKLSAKEPMRQLERQSREVAGELSAERAEKLQLLA